MGEVYPVVYVDTCCALIVSRQREGWFRCGASRRPKFVCAAKAMHSALHSALHMEAATSFASQAYDPCARESPTLEALGWIGLTLAVLVFLAPVETIYKVAARQIPRRL